MPEFDKYWLRSFKIGGEQIGFTRSEKMLHIAGEDWTVEQWLATADRVQRQLEQEGWVEKPRHHDPNSGSSSFLTVNVKDVTSRQRGKIKPSPWPLKPFYDAVITKEVLHDT